jgi:hypothetical protein
MELAITEQRLSQKAQLVILAVAVLQGVTLYWFQQSIENNWWPDNSGPVVTVLGLWLSVLPTTFVLSFRTSVATKSYWTSLFIMLLVLSAMGIYFGRAHDLDAMREGGVAAMLAATVLWFIVLFWFKAALYEQRVWPTYASMFGYSWHNFLCVALASFFTLIAFGVLMLWGALFDVININFFSALFQRSWFLFPALVLAFAYALILFRTEINAVGAVQRILRALFSILLPVLGVVAALFLVFLPLTGATLIWVNGYGSDTILLFVGIVLFLFNAVFQDADQAPYGDRLTRLVRFIPIVLTVLLTLAVYGIALRIEQYGLTVERIWAVIVLGLMFAYSLAYSLHALLSSASWKVHFASINRVMACVVGAVCLLVVTPLVSLDKLSIASQLKRLETGRVSLEQFDYAYLARLGGHGIASLKELAGSKLMVNQARALASLETAIDTNGSIYAVRSNKSSEHLDAVIENIIVYPPYAEINVDKIVQNNALDNLEQCEREFPCVLVMVDINGDAVTDTILLTPNHQETYQASRIVEYSPGQYHNVGYVNFEVNPKTLIDAIQRGDVDTPASQWKNLKIGDYVIKLGEPLQ